MLQSGKGRLNALHTTTPHSAAEPAPNQATFGTNYDGSGTPKEATRQSGRGFVAVARDHAGGGQRAGPARRDHRAGRRRPRIPGSPSTGSIRWPISPTASRSPDRPISNTAMRARSGASAMRATARLSPPTPTSICRATAATIRSAFRAGLATPGFPALWVVFEERLYLFYTARGAAGLHRQSDVRSRVGLGALGRRSGANSSNSRLPANLSGGRWIAPGDETRDAKADMLAAVARAAHRPVPTTTPPAATTTAWPRPHPIRRSAQAADRGRSRLRRAGRISTPSQMPLSCTGATRCRKEALTASKWLRLTAATRSPFGHGRVWIRVARRGMSAVLAWRELQPFGAMVGCAAPDQAERWRRHHARGRRTTSDERDIHRVFEPAGEELSGSVERIDQQELRGRLNALPMSSASSDTTGIPGARRVSPS